MGGERIWSTSDDDKENGEKRMLAAKFGSSG